MSIKKLLLTFVLIIAVVAIPVAIRAATSPSPDDVKLQSEIDQLFIIGFRGTTYAKSPELSKALSTTNLGGIVLFDYDTPTKKYVRNIQTGAQVTALIKSAQSHAKSPLLVGIDEEGGAVSRLKTIKGYKKTASAVVLGKESDAAVTKVATDLGTYLKKLGFNMDFAPDLDVNVQPTSPAIGKVGRSFSDNADTVAEKGISFMNGLKADNVISVGKHFPGHGSALADSHLGFTNITDTYSSVELNPFQKACAAGLPAIMVGHLFNGSIDTVPASLSAKHIQNLKNIGCGNAVIISDDMDMKAITTIYGRKDSFVMALNAGIDMMILSNNITTYTPTEYLTARKMVFDAVKAGDIQRSRIDEAYQKVQTLKKNFGIVK